MPACLQSPAACSSSRQKKKTGAEPSLLELNVNTNEKKDEKLVDPPSVVCVYRAKLLGNLQNQWKLLRARQPRYTRREKDPNSGLGKAIWIVSDLFPCGRRPAKREG
ncbi:hypothetical protein L6164_005476 [Bauhinia variegata]|uniref:Uncharacterized protein n=1 Tax=Bauhinia variegata TaxID=167791 RepID=A0ACB9PRX1_BAUVA|nr:hypothetical protein L6164_005476 [Bauhinia variegata]